MYRIFLADDEPWVLLGLKNMIDWKAEGFELCGEATDGEKAWDRICRLIPDLVISDIRMPGLSGIELVRRIRGEKLSVEVIFMSGYSEFEYARAGLKYGCLDYLLKPVYEEDLLQCLERTKRLLREKRQEERQPKREELKEDSAGRGGAVAQGEMPAYRSESTLAMEMVQYMQEHYRDVTQGELAEKFCLCASAVSQIIKRYTGKNYSDHLLDIRIGKAQELLRSTNESIDRIAEMSGYSDYFYFVKVFKKATGISPSAYRKGL